MSLSAYFEEHEEQAFVAKALATAAAIILFKNYFSGFISFLFLIFPVVFLIGIKMQAAATGTDAMELLREHITFLPVMRSEADRRTEVTPWVTYGLILVNALLFYFFELNVPDEVIDNLIFLPAKPNLFNVPISAFTSMFLHADNGHLWGNMTFLWVVGTAVERRVGRQRFFWLYLVTGLIGGLVYILVEFLFHGRAGHALGASGAIAGIMGIFAIRCYFKSMIFPVPILGVFSLILPISLKIRLNSLVIMALFFLSDLSGGIHQITGQSDSMVGHWAHLGGMISGILIAARLRLGEDAVEERHLEIGLKASEAATGYGGGERSLQIALDRSPDNIDALLGMARLKTKFTDRIEGKEFYERALHLMMRERPAEVIGVFQEYFAKYRTVPPDPALVSRLAEMLRKAGEVEDCINCLERLVKMPDTPPHIQEKALYQLAVLFEFTSRFEAAASTYARFAAEYPDSLLAEKAREKAGPAAYTAPTPIRHTGDRDVAAKADAPAGANSASGPACPECGATMAVRAARSGAHQGKNFWVCGTYPACRGHLPVEEAADAAERRPVLTPLPERYQIILDGTIPFTSDPEETKENLARLMRCGRDRVDALFNGDETVIKRGLDRATAVRYKEALDGTGALCAVREEKREPAPVVLPQAPSPSSTAQPRPAAAITAAAIPAAAPKPEMMSCPKCGEIQEKAEFCSTCGVYFAKLARQVEREFHAFQEHLPGGAAQKGMSEKAERVWAMWCHLSALSGFVIPLGNVLGPLAIWLWKRKKSEFVDYHGKTALNYQITVVIFLVGLIFAAVLTGFAAIFVGPLFGLVGTYTLGMIAVAAAKSYRGDWVEIGLSAEFIK